MPVAADEPKEKSISNFTIELMVIHDYARNAKSFGRNISWNERIRGNRHILERTIGFGASGRSVQTTAKKGFSLLEHVKKPETFK